MVFCVQYSYYMLYIFIARLKAHKFTVNYTKVIIIYIMHLWSQYLQGKEKSKMNWHSSSFHIFI